MSIEDSLYRAYVEDAQLDNYLAGGMSDYEAYNLGLVDASATLCTSGSVIAQNKPLNTLDYCNYELAINTLKLDNIDTSNNYAKHSPTCRCCKTVMLIRKGKYGLFYYCSNSCKTQKLLA